MIRGWARRQPAYESPVYANAGPWAQLYKPGGTLAVPPETAGEFLDHLAALPPGADPGIASALADNAYRLGANIAECVTVLQRWHDSA